MRAGSVRNQKKMTEETVSDRSTYTLARDQVSSDLQGEVVILNFQSGKYYGLDAVGSRIWHLLHEMRTVAEIRDAIVAEYEVEPECCERDLRRLLGKLVDQGLVEVREEGKR
jgi:hypothetical protein